MDKILEFVANWSSSYGQLTQLLGLDYTCSCSSRDLILNFLMISFQLFDVPSVCPFPQFCQQPKKKEGLKISFKNLALIFGNECKEEYCHKSLNQPSSTSDSLKTSSYSPQMKPKAQT